MESAGNGKANFDHEDPDMDDWSDFDDDENENENLERDGDDDEAYFATADERDAASRDGDNNEDAFMDADSSDGDHDDGEALGAIGIRGSNENDSFSRDDVFPFEFENGSEDDEFSDDQLNKEQKSTKKKSKGTNASKKSESIYADAEEYERLIEDGSKNLNREYEAGSDSGRNAYEQNGSDLAEAMSEEYSSQKNKKRRRNKQ